MWLNFVMTGASNDGRSKSRLIDRWSKRRESLMPPHSAPAGRKAGTEPERVATARDFA